MSNSLNPDQAQRSVGPDLGQNCLQRFSADNTSRQRGAGKELQQQRVCYMSGIHMPIFHISQGIHDFSPNNVACATSKGSDQPAHMRSLIRALLVA